MKAEKRKIDWSTMLIPFGIVIAMMAVFMVAPEASKSVVDTLRGFFGDTIGIYYPLVAIGAVLCSVYIALTPKYGNVRLGNIDKPILSWRKTLCLIL